VTAVELQEIADRFAIAEVLYRYSTALDTRDWALLHEVFTPDGVYRMGVRGEFTGPDAIAEKLQEVLGRLDATQHLIGNPMIVVEGDTARCSSYVRAQHYRTRHATGGNTLDMGGTYVDELVRTEDGWRIAHRVLEITWREGNGGIRD
jgi:3-phenylpropionate/cinnamic acid dioxygenase small subunit